MTIAPDLLAAIGNTPLIKLRRASQATGCTILGKAEFMNPGGSVKDRAALFMVQDAVKQGRLRPGGVIVEGTAGNTGIGPRARRQRHGLPHRHRDPGDPEPGEEGHAAARGRRARRGAGGAVRQPQQLREGVGPPRRALRGVGMRLARSGPTSSTTPPTATVTS
jgi:hypothetical protein